MIAPGQATETIRRVTMVSDKPGDLSGGETVTTVARWSGREVRALREARRMSVREFAAHLGVSDRMVSKWEAGGLSIRPRPINQEALDTSLARASPEARQRFDRAVQERGATALVDLPQQRGGQPMHAGTSHLVVHPDDGKLMTLVAAGAFRAGEDRRQIWLQGFYIDVYPTTNADYSRFLAATGHRPPAHWVTGQPPSALLRHPVVGVTWPDARAYAVWAAKSLPTGWQWEKAARGTTGAPYPWGNLTPPPCNVRESGLNATTPVDRYPEGVSAFGVHDLCGNVWEWCETATSPGRRQVKGGSFSAPLRRAAPSAFTDASAEVARPDTGFRCVCPIEGILELLCI